MIVIGMDGSKNGTGVVAAKVNDKFEIVKIDCISFTQIKKLETEKIKFHHITKSFNDDQSKICWVRDEVTQFINDFIGTDDSDCYTAIEDYAHNTVGRQFDKGEICGMLKIVAYDTFRSKLRKYSPKTIKKYAGHGDYDKVAMCEAYLEGEKELTLPDDLKDLVKVNDVVDAYWICKLLIRELQLKSGQITKEDLCLREQELFAVKSKDETKNYTTKRFEEWHTNLVSIDPKTKKK